MKQISRIVCNGVRIVCFKNKPTYPDYWHDQTRLYDHENAVGYGVEGIKPLKNEAKAIKQANCETTEHIITGTS